MKQKKMGWGARMAAQTFAAQGKKTPERVGSTAISKEVRGGPTPDGILTPTDWAASPSLATPSEVPGQQHQHHLGPPSSGMLTLSIRILTRSPGYSCAQ